MTLEALHDVLLRYLDDEGAVQMAIDAWEDLWHQSQNFPDEPLPCPRCFLDSHVQRLVPMEGIGGLAAVRCECCKNTFEFRPG